MIALAAIGYLAIILVAASFVGRYLRRQRKRIGRLPELQAVKDEPLDIGPALRSSK